MDEQDLIGKTIVGVQRYAIKGCDDDAWLELKFSDGTRTLIVGSYGGWTAKSASEYPAFVELSDDYDGLTAL